MKKLVLLFMVASSMASAACFNFVNGKGPERLGNFRFTAPATRLCLQTVNRFGGGSVPSLKFSDAEGDLAVAGAEVTAQGRCASLCKELTLTSGNINGANVNLSGIRVSITTDLDPHLGMLNGVVTIQAGRDFPQKYLILGSK